MLLVKWDKNTMINVKLLQRIIIFLCMLALFGCAAKSGIPYAPRPIEESPFLERTQTQSRAGLTVTVSVLSPMENRQVFGVDLESQGVQPVWLKIRNESDKSYMFLPISVDPKYYSPGEVSFKFKDDFSKSDYIVMDEYLEKLNLNLTLIPPGKERSGFVYTDMDPGVKYVNAALYSFDELQDFDFFIDVPGITTPSDEVDFDSFYAENEIVNYENTEELRVALEGLPCCTTDKDGNGEGNPANFVFIGRGEDIRDALIRQKWDVAETVPENIQEIETTLFSSGRYRTTPISDFYFYGRRQDLGLQKARQTRRGNLRQRIEMRLWLSPIRFKSEDVWVGAISTDVGSEIKIKDFKIVEEKQIDPNTDEARDYLVEDIVFSGNVSKLGRVKAIEPADSYNPHTNLKEQPWWTDGYRMVFLFQEEPLTLRELEFFPWEGL
jgi:hypothetical protein